MDESIDAQIRAIEEYADKNDIKIVNKFIDRAKSATSDKRPAFQEMIKYCEAEIGRASCRERVYRLV